MKKLLEMTTHEVARGGARLCFWPVGTIEAHDLGPLGTDVIAPQKLAETLCAEFGALLLPTLPYGLVSSLAGFPGSIWVSEQTYRAFVLELLSSLTRTGIEAVVVFNGHGGNSDALARTLPEVWKQTGIKTAFIDWWAAAADLAEQHFGAAGGHGGADELALVHAANPALLPESWDGSRAYLARAGVRAYPSPRSAIRFSTGEVRTLTAESARAYFTDVVERLRLLLREILAGWQINAGGSPHSSSSDSSSV